MNFLYFCTREVRDVAIGKNAANNLLLKIGLAEIFTTCSMATLFVILNGACFIFAVEGNVREKCCFLKNALEFYFQLFL